MTQASPAGPKTWGRATTFVWPHEDTMRVPYQVYVDPDLYEREQQRLFQGPTWNFLALEAEIPNAGDYKATFVGDAPIVVARKSDGAISAVVNRCAHKGAILCFKLRGNIKEFTASITTGSMTSTASCRGWHSGAASAERAA
jgi:anthranilate 1,2-dioxygenase large subunit